MKQLAIALVTILSCCLPSLAFTANSSPGNVYLSHAVTDLLVEVKNKKNNNKGSDNQDNAALSECTIIQPGGGGGCTAPLKWVCEKMKGGKKCCGCVGDKNAAPAKKADDKPQLLVFACTASVQTSDGRVFDDNRKAGIRAASAEEARVIYMSRLGQGVVLLGQVTCTQSN